MRDLRWFLWVPLCLVLGCKTNQKAVYAPDKVVPTEKSILWKISGNGLKKSSYLYGTIHMIPKKEFKLSEQAIHALDNTKRITYEIDMKEMTSFRTQLSLMNKAFMSGGKTLKDLLSPADYTYVKEKMDAKGLPFSMFERMKPMFLSTMFSGGEDGDNKAFGRNDDITSVETELYKAGKKRHLESAGLETADYQMAIFDSIPYEVQAKMLIDGLRSESQATSGESELDQMLKMYHDQDITAMQSMIVKDQTGMSNYEDILLDRRNRNWIDRMARFMKEKPTLFAVGAGHLGGPKGVIALLRKAGYHVEPAT
jgi:hypothetical protein